MWVSRCIGPPALSLETRWKLMVNFTLLLLNPQERTAVPIEEGAEWAREPQISCPLLGVKPSPSTP